MIRIAFIISKISCTVGVGSMCSNHIATYINSSKHKIIAGVVSWCPPLQIYQTTPNSHIHAFMLRNIQLQLWQAHILHMHIYIYIYLYTYVRIPVHLRIHTCICLMLQISLIWNNCRGGRLISSPRHYTHITRHGGGGGFDPPPKR